MDPLPHIGAALKRIRIARDLSISDAAEAAGVTRKTLGSYEQSQHFTGHAARLDQILVAMHGVSPLRMDEIRPILARVNLPTTLALLNADANVEEIRDEPQDAGEVAHNLVDALIAVAGPKRAIAMIASLLASAAEPRDKSDTGPGPTPAGVVAVHHPPVETEDGEWEVRVYQKRPGDEPDQRPDERDNAKPRPASAPAPARS